MSCPAPQGGQAFFIFTMSKLKQYLNEEAVQIGLTAVLVQILLVLLLNDNFALLGTVDFIITILAFSFIVGMIAYLIGRDGLSMFKLFLIGFLGVIIYNQGIVILSLINQVPFTKDLLVGVEMGILTMIVGRVKGVKK